MEPLFENRYLANRQHVKEFIQATYWKRTSMIICCVLLLFVFLLGWMQILLPFLHKNVFIGWLFVAFSVIMSGYLLLVYVLTSRLQYTRQMTVSQGQEPVVRVRITDTGIETCNENNQNTLSLSLAQIKKVTQSDTLILLWLKGRMAVILRKDSFVTGTAEEFLDFLKAKRPDLKI